jgi:hypothetical protein
MSFRIQEALVSGQVGSVAELATVEGIRDRYVSSLLPLAFLTPDKAPVVSAQWTEIGVKPPKRV